MRTRTPASRLLAALVGALVAGFALAPTLALGQQMRSTVPDATGISSARLGWLSATLEQSVRDGQVAGAVALIARDGRIVYEAAFGHRDIESGDPMRPDAIFRIASQTKAVTSVAAMILVEQGRLRLSDPIADYLPAFTDPLVAVPADDGGYDTVPAERPITVRDLLTHTSGLSYGTGLATAEYQTAGVYAWYFADKDEPIAASVDRIAALPLDAQPGERWIYGFSTDVLGAVIERASGLDLDTFFRNEIFDPLSMHDTHFYLPPEKVDRLATVYMATEEGGIERAPDAGLVGQGAYVEGPRRSYSGGAGLLSTARDYARFLQMLLNGGELEGVRILSPKTVELMRVNHVGDRFPGPGNGFGLGFRVTLDLGLAGGYGSEGAYGWGGAYHTVYWIDPDERLIACLMTQLIPARDVDLRSLFSTLVYQALIR